MCKLLILIVYYQRLQKGQWDWIVSLSSGMLDCGRASQLASMLAFRLIYYKNALRYWNKNACSGKRPAEGKEIENNHDPPRNPRSFLTQNWWISYMNCKPLADWSKLFPPTRGRSHKEIIGTCGGKGGSNGETSKAAGITSSTSSGQNEELALQVLFMNNLSP